MVPATIATSVTPAITATLFESVMPAITATNCLLCNPSDYSFAQVRSMGLGAHSNIVYSGMLTNSIILWGSHCRPRRLQLHGQYCRPRRLQQPDVIQAMIADVVALCTKRYFSPFSLIFACYLHAKACSINKACFIFQWVIRVVTNGDATFLYSIASHHT